MWVDLDLGPEERDEPALRRREVAVQVDLEHRFHIRGIGDGPGGLLGHVRPGEGLQRDEDLGAGFAQDRGDLVWLKQRVDRVCDAHRHGTEERHDRFVRVREEVGDHVGFANAERAEEVGRLGGFSQKLGPCERFGLVLGAREDLVGDGGSVAPCLGGPLQLGKDRGGQIPVLPWHGVFNGKRVGDRTEFLHDDPPLPPVSRPRFLNQ